MALKTFNLNGQLYNEFSEYCKKHGIIMSKKIENFIRDELEYLKSGEKLQVKRFVKKIDFESDEHPIGKYC